MREAVPVLCFAAFLVVLAGFGFGVSLELRGARVEYLKEELRQRDVIVAQLRGRCNALEFAKRASGGLSGGIISPPASPAPLHVDTGEGLDDYLTRLDQCATPADVDGLHARLEADR